MKLTLTRATTKSLMCPFGMRKSFVLFRGKGVMGSWGHGVVESWGCGVMGSWGCGVMVFGYQDGQGLAFSVTAI